MLLIAIKMLFGDKGKYLMLISALTFASLLIAQQSGVFCGLMRWTTALLRNTNAKVWVVDPKVEQINEIKMLKETDLYRVRSVAGVAWAVPFFSSIQQAHLADGSFVQVMLLGLDPSTLIGAPAHLIAGNLADIRQANSVLIDEVARERLSLDPKRPLEIGDTFEINDHAIRVAAICKAERSFFDNPYIYTTYNRAVEIAPKTRKTLSYILVEPLAGITPEGLARRIEQQTSLKAYTEHEFFWSTIWWFVKNTGIPVSFATTILIGFIVGLAVAGQTFYTFIVENLPNFGALKAMGANSGLLYRMIFLQAFIAGFIGFGLGLGITAAFGFKFTEEGVPPFFIPYHIPFMTFGAMMVISFFSSIMGIYKINRLEVAEVFRV